MPAALLAVIGLAVALAGAVVGDNFRGVTGRFAGWAARTNPRITRGRGPHRWLDVRFQTLVYRVYGWVLFAVGAVVFSVAVHH